MNLPLARVRAKSSREGSSAACADSHREPPERPPESPQGRADRRSTGRRQPRERHPTRTDGFSTGGDRLPAPPARAKTADGFFTVSQAPVPSGFPDAACAIQQVVPQQIVPNRLEPTTGRGIIPIPHPGSSRVGRRDRPVGPHRGAPDDDGFGASRDPATQGATRASSNLVHRVSAIAGGAFALHVFGVRSRVSACRMPRRSA